MAGFLRPKPLGDYRYGVEAIDGDLDKLAFADPVPEPLKIFDPTRIYGGGSRVSPVNMPTKLRLTGRKRRLVDFDNASHMYMVTRRVVDLVESFQRDIQYFPIECFWTDGSSAGQFFLLFTTVLLDAVNRDKTTATWTPTRDGVGLWTAKPGETFVFDRSRLGDTHMWVDPSINPPCALITDTLWRALLDAKIEAFFDCGYWEEI